MLGQDQVFEGDQARDWIRELGSHGDNVRMAIVNPILVHVLKYVAPNQPATAVFEPLKIIRTALADLEKVTGREATLDETRIDRKLAPK